MMIKFNKKMNETINKIQEEAAKFKNERPGNSPTEIWEKLKVYESSLSLLEKEKERFYVIGMDIRHNIKFIDITGTGTNSRAIVEPRETFRMAILAGVNSIVIAHNHPAGSLEPSSEDKLLTTTLVKAGKIVGIEILDHIIISDKGYYSFTERNNLY